MNKNLTANSVGWLTSASKFILLLTSKTLAPSCTFENVVNFVQESDFYSEARAVTGVYPRITKEK